MDVESGIHRHGIRNPQRGIRNPRLSWITLHGAILGLRIVKRALTLPHDWMNYSIGEILEKWFVKSEF